MIQVLCLCTVVLITVSACSSALTPQPLLPDPAGQAQENRAITPRTKGSTLELTPRTKGSTLLNGVVIWPEESQVSPDGFAITLLQEGKIIRTVMSDKLGKFELTGIPTAGRLRIEARATHDPELILKRELELYEDQLYAETHVSVESTALVAVLDKSRQMGSALQNMPLQELESASIQAELSTIKTEMMPFLDQNMKQSLESMPSVQSAVDLAWENLEQKLSKDRSKLETQFILTGQDLF